MAFAGLLLSDCPAEKAFWTTDGVTIRSLRGLCTYLEGVKPEVFRYHVNKDHNKNDFADWIRDVFEDQELAARLEGVLDKEKYVRIIRKSLKQFE